MVQFSGRLRRMGRSEDYTSTGHRRRSWAQRNKHKIVSVLLAAPLIGYVLIELLRGSV